MPLPLICAGWAIDVAPVTAGTDQHVDKANQAAKATDACRMMQAEYFMADRSKSGQRKHHCDPATVDYSQTSSSLRYEPLGKISRLLSVK